MQLPTEKEIKVYGSLDEICASQHFLGKSLQDAEALLRENSINYMGDYMWMGSKAFVFYAPSLIRYLLSEASRDDSDAVNSFAGIMEFRLEYYPESITPIAAELAGVCDSIIAHWDKHDVDPRIYKKLRTRIESLPAKIRALEAATSITPISRVRRDGL